MKILAIETSSEHASLALGEDFEVVASSNSEGTMWKGLALSSMLSGLLQKAQWDIKDLQLVTVGLGPGSYTGMRIAVTAARTLALAIEVDIVGICSMDLRACRVSGQPCDVVVNGWQQQFYVAHYEQIKDVAVCSGEVQVVAASDMAERLSVDVPILFDSGLEKVMDLSEYQCYSGLDAAPLASDLLRIGFERYQQSGPDEAKELLPMYLRKTPAEDRLDARSVHVMTGKGD